jgi:hypothetical protein
LGWLLAEIAQAYFHLKRIDISQQELNFIGDQISVASFNFARDLVAPEATIEVRLSEGSLKGWITVTSILAVYGLVADYKGFKESIVEMQSDARKFGDQISEFVFKRKEIEGAEIYRKERRTKTLGRIKRFIERREKLKSGIGQLPQHIIDSEYNYIQKMFQDILSDFDENEQKVIKKLFEDDIPHSPDAHIPRIGVLHSRNQQMSLIGTFSDNNIEPHANYRNKFRLSDGLKLKLEEK